MASAPSSWQWKQPSGAPPALKLNNSLTRNKETFVPQNGNNVRWYSCGPTVYDASHMGHARSYISFDILRRVLQDYFGYTVEYVMNITDLDDKIIVKARRKYLLEQYLKSPPAAETVLADIAEARERLQQQSVNDPDPDKRTLHTNTLATVDKAIAEYKALASPDDAALRALLAAVKDPLSVLLDKRLGATVTDHSIFTALTQQYEREFHDDMRALNVRAPDVLTRVTEYIPQIVAYVEQIISNGYAYASKGSVYFDTAAFQASPTHKYAKLVPEAVGNKAALDEGEGELSSGQQEKRGAADFALWKASKPGEPAWDSPWGKGRPGWHIECSVMASDVIGEVMDIHTGGVDLKFPHHDNEIAQAEAFYGHQQWVNYFLHSGHLKIEGLKMSKSLKNFITIKDALAKYSGRQLRFAFLMHKWDATLDYSADVMQQAIQKEKFFNEFFLNVKALHRAGAGVFIPMSAPDRALLEAFRAAKTNVHAALCDNIDTAGALQVLQELVGAVNVYIRERERSGALDTMLLKNIAAWITNLFRIFGLLDDFTGIGFPLGSQAQAAEDAIMPELLEFAALRDDIRRSALVLKNIAALQECDRIRDELLPQHGVRLEDRDKGPAVVKLVDKEELMKEKQREQEEREEKARAKAEAARKKAEAEAAKLAQSKINPADMFRGRSEFSQFDADGIPTHTSDGNEVSKSARKKLEKERAAQDKLYQQYLATQAAAAPVANAAE